MVSLIFYFHPYLGKQSNFKWVETTNWYFCPTIGELIYTNESRGLRFFLQLFQGAAPPMPPPRNKIRPLKRALLRNNDDDTWYDDGWWWNIRHVLRTNSTRVVSKTVDNIWNMVPKMCCFYDFGMEWNNFFTFETPVTCLCFQVLLDFFWHHYILVPSMCVCQAPYQWSGWPLLGVCWPSIGSASCLAKVKVKSCKICDCLGWEKGGWKFSLPFLIGFIGIPWNRNP